MSRTIKITALAMAILAFFLFVGSPFQQTAQAIAIVDDAFIAILIAALAACGISFAVTQEYGNLANYVKSLWYDFVEDSSTTSNYLTQGVQYGRNKLGQILINNRFVTLIDTFIIWVKAKLGLTNNSTKQLVLTGYSVTDDRGTVYLVPCVEDADYWYSISGGNRYKVTYINATAQEKANTYWVLFRYPQTGGYAIELGIVSKYNVSVAIRQVFTEGSSYDGTATYTLTNRNNHSTYYASLRSNVESDFNYSNIPISDVQYNMSSNNAWINHDWVQPAYEPAGIYVNTGVIVNPSSDQDYTPGDGAILDVGGLWSSDLDEILNGDIPDALDDSGELDASMEYVGEDVVAEDVVEDSSLTNSVSSNVSDYQTPGLQSVFPFCIPFDIYSFFECLAADPVAPAFTWRFYVPGICDEEFTVDLAPFSTVAQIVRTMELLAFIVGLALVTRDKFLRG